MLEQQVQSKIIKYIQSVGGYYAKVISASKKGVPDLLVCYKGRFIGLEVKTPKTKNNASALQLYNIEEIKKAGGEAYVVWSVEQVKEILC